MTKRINRNLKIYFLFKSIKARRSRKWARSPSPKGLRKSLASLISTFQTKRTKKNTIKFKVRMVLKISNVFTLLKKSLGGKCKENKIVLTIRF